MQLKSNSATKINADNLQKTALSKFTQALVLLIIIRRPPNEDQSSSASMPSQVTTLSFWAIPGTAACAKSSITLFVVTLHDKDTSSQHFD
jgi:hypothetical protein